MEAAENAYMDEKEMTIPSLIVRGADEAIDFYQRAFGARLHSEEMRIPGTNRVIHTELTIGDSIFFVAEEFPQMKSFSPKHYNGTPVSMHVRVKDCDKTYNDAVAAGAQTTMPPADMFWGDRYAQVVDPFGHVWAFATPKERLTHQQVEQRAKEFFANWKK